MQTYKIIGTDQKEYGPVSADQLRQWIAQRRVVAQTMAQADGGEWKNLGSFPEFAADFGNPIPASPAFTPAPSFASTPRAEIIAPPATSGLAIASLVLGICGIISCDLSAIVGLILGIMAMSQIRKSNGTLGGRGIALAGTIISSVFLLIGVLVLGAAIYFQPVGSAKGKATGILCMNNARQLSLAARMYADNHEHHLPPAETWCESLQPYVTSRSAFKCPAGNPSDRCNYGFNSQLDGMDLNKVNPNTVLFFEIEGGWDVSGGQDLLLNHARHGSGIVVVFVDGHSEMVTAYRIASLRWNP